MARSRRKPYVKDRGMTTQEYWKPIRHEWKQQIKNAYTVGEQINYYFEWDTKRFDMFYDLRQPKEIINDWSYCDFRWFIYERHENDPWYNDDDRRYLEKFKRK